MVSTAVTVYMYFMAVAGVPMTVTDTVTVTVTVAAGALASLSRRPGVSRVSKVVQGTMKAPHATVQYLHRTADGWRHDTPQQWSFTRLLDVVAGDGVVHCVHLK